MGPRAPRSSRPSSPRAAHEGSKLIFGSSSRSRVSIARASHQRPRSLQTRATRREAPKLPGSQAQGPPGYPYGIALRFHRGQPRLRWRLVFATSRRCPTKVRNDVMVSRYPAARCSSPPRCITLGGKGRGAMAISSGERRSSASAGVSTRGRRVRGAGPRLDGMSSDLRIAELPVPSRRAHRGRESPAPPSSRPH